MLKSKTINQVLKPSPSSELALIVSSSTLFFKEYMIYSLRRVVQSQEKSPHFISRLRRERQGHPLFLGQQILLSTNLTPKHIASNTGKLLVPLTGQESFTYLL